MGEGGGGRGRKGELKGGQVRIHTGGGVLP